MLSVDELVVAIRDRVNYAEIFGEFLQMRGRGDERMAFCVFHENTDTPSLSVNVRDGLYYCQNPACGAKGDFFDFYKRKRSLTFTEAIHELAQRYGIDTSDTAYHPAGYTVNGGDPTRRPRSEDVLDAYVGKMGRIDSAAPNGVQPAATPIENGSVANGRAPAAPRSRRRSKGVAGQESNRDEERLTIEPSIPDAFHARLLATPDYLDYLTTHRGLTRATIDAYGIGHDGRRYTIPVRDLDLAIVNIRRYDPQAKQAHEKMVSWRSGFGEARLFPLDQWQMDGPIYLHEGEWDTLVSRQLGFNAYTVTTGAGTWRDAFTPLFRNRDVIICYDCDDAGRKGAANVARQLHETASSIKIVRLPLAQSGADITDYFVKHGHAAEDFAALVAATPVYTPSEKDAIPLSDREPMPVHLSRATEKQYYNQPIRVNVMVSGKTTAPYLVPHEVKLSCRMPGLKMCERCPVAKQAGSLNHKIEFESNEILQFINVSESTLAKQIKGKVGIPTKCTYVEQSVNDALNIEVIQVIPEVERGSENEGTYVTREAYYIGHGLQANRSYVMNGVTVPEPRRQLATHLIYEAVPAQSNIDAFSLTPTIIERLKAFQPQEPGVQGLWNQLTRIYDDLEGMTRIYQRRDLMLGTDLTYHSLITFNFQGEPLKRGWGQTLIIGDSRTGKSTIVERLLDHYGAGEFTTGENTSFAGLVGGLHQVGTSWALQWGRIPLNDRRLLVIDEAGNLSQEHIGRMSSMRSGGVAEIVKIHTEKTFARTRQIWISNPRGNKPLSFYSQGVLAVKEMIGAPEDIARFDIILTAASADVPLEIVNATRIDAPPQIFTSDLCHQRVMWAWSRTSESVVWSEGATDAVLALAMQHGETYRYGTEIPLVEPNEQRIKIARLSVATAAMFFSTDDEGSVVIVRPEHVEFVGQFLDTIYSKPSLAFTEFANNMRRRYEITGDDAVARIMRQNEGAVRAMLEQEAFSLRDLQEILGTDDRTALRNAAWTLRNAGFLRKGANNNYVKTPAAIRWLREELATRSGRSADGDGFGSLTRQASRPLPPPDDDGDDPGW